MTVREMPKVEGIDWGIDQMDLDRGRRESATAQPIQQGTTSMHFNTSAFPVRKARLRALPCACSPGVLATPRAPPVRVAQFELTCICGCPY